MKALLHFRGFRERLLLLAAVALAPTLALALFNCWEQRRQGSAQVKENAVRVAKLAAANQEAFVSNARNLMAAIAQSPLALSEDAAMWQSHFSNLLRLQPMYANFGLIETGGLLFASALPADREIDLGDRSYFRRVMETDQFAVGDLQSGRLTGQITVNFGYPVHDNDGRLARVLFAALVVNRMGEVAAKANLPPNSVLEVLDRTGNIVTRYPDSGESLVSNDARARIVSAILKTQEGAMMSEEGGVEKRLYAFAPVRSGGKPCLYVSVGIPAELAFASAHALLWRNLVFVALIALLALWLARRYSNRFLINPLRLLVDSANRLAAGEMTARIGNLRGAGELNLLGRAFDEMAERLESRQKELERANQKVGRLNAELESRVAERTAELAAANQEMEAFSYSVSHDLRAPLRHIDGFVGILQKDSSAALDEKGKRCLTVISQAAKQMGNLIDDLLSFSRMGRKEITRTQVNTRLQVEDVIQELEPETAGRAIEWRIGDLPGVEGDVSMIRQVWMNLLSNAIKYTRNREIARIEIACEEDSPSEVVYVVRDNGAGFDMDYAHKLFGVFQRLHGDAEFEGTGIGLANVRRIVSRHGGRVWAEGEVGQGAVFYFSLPRYRNRKCQTDEAGSPG